MSDNTELYVATGYVEDGYVTQVFAAPAAPTPTTVQQTIPQVLYWEYADDSDLQAFVAGFNQLTQNYVDTFNGLNLPVYAGNDLISGALLDWVAQGLYGMVRPVLSSGSLTALGSYNTMPYNSVPYDALQDEGQITYLATTDDIFKRILTWNLYRGDGKTFTVQWLKRRVMRFLLGANGTDPGIDNTYLVSVKFGANRTVTIDLSAFVASQPSSETPTILQSCVKSGAVQLPFQYSFVVNV